jgi:hypothetical protein
LHVGFGRSHFWGRFFMLLLFHIQFQALFPNREYNSPLLEIFLLIGCLKAIQHAGHWLGWHSYLHIDRFTKAWFVNIFNIYVSANLERIVEFITSLVIMVSCANFIFSIPRQIGNI